MSRKNIDLRYLGLIAALLSGAAAAAEDNHGQQPSILQIAQASAGQQPSAGQRPVGQAPPKQAPAPPPKVEAIADVGGVLTPKGTLVVEPSLQVSTSQVNQFNFNGVSILDTLLIGLINAEDTDRDLVEAALGFRLGLTDRLEIGIKVPYIYRHETTTLSLVSLEDQTQSEGPAVDETLEDGGLGDVEASLHYQINRGLNGWPFFIANLRYKSTTGKGPFDVHYNAQALPTELATGSGFHGIEPSLTILLPSDPAVFFANFGYLFNLAADVDKTIGKDDQARRIGEVDPGDAFRMSFGMAYALNQYSSFNLGYKNDYIFPTRTEINGIHFNSDRLEVGALLLGFSYAVSPRAQANVSLEVGVTADAPDIVLTFRLPFAFGLY